MIVCAGGVIRNSACGPFCEFFVLRTRRSSDSAMMHQNKQVLLQAVDQISHLGQHGTPQTGFFFVKIYIMKRRDVLFHKKNNAQICITKISHYSKSNFRWNAILRHRPGWQEDYSLVHRTHDGITHSWSYLTEIHPRENPINKWMMLHIYILAPWRHIRRRMDIALTSHRSNGDSRATPVSSVTCHPKKTDYGSVV